MSTRDLGTYQPFIDMMINRPVGCSCGTVFIGAHGIDKKKWPTKYPCKTKCVWCGREMEI